MTDEIKNDSITVAESDANSALPAIPDDAQFQRLWRMGSLLSKSQFVPERFRGKPEDCVVGIQMAARLQADPLMVLQNVQVIHGTPGMSAKFQFALANQRGPFSGPIRFRTEGEGETLKVTAYATFRDGGDTVEASASMAMAAAEGWTKNGKYQSMPEQMLRYRAGTLLIRLYCPEVVLGMQTADELEDMTAAAKTEKPPAIKNIEAQVVDPKPDLGGASVITDDRRALLDAALGKTEGNGE